MLFIKYIYTCTNFFFKLIPPLVSSASVIERDCNPSEDVIISAKCGPELLNSKFLLKSNDVSARM